MNKESLSHYIKEQTGFDVPYDSGTIYDVQMSNITGCKRILLNILACLHRYIKIKENREKEFTEVIPKKVVIFAGKSCVQDIE